MSRICYSFASRNRPARFFQCLDNIREMSTSDDYFIWAKLDVDDQFADMYKNRLDEYPEVTVRWGMSKSKIDAINRSMKDLPPCDIIIMQSDDIVWDVKGFDDEIRKAFEENFPDFSGTIHFPDDHGKMNTVIVSILGINLYKRLGYLYHPDFISVYADNLFTEQTRRLNKYVFVDKRLFTHAHPHWNLADWDSQYKATEAPENYKQDKETFLRLKANNFGL